MPYNGSGGTSQPASSIYPAVPITLIESAKFNISIADIYTMLASAILKDGQQTITQNIPFNGKKITGLGAGAIAGDALRYEQVLGLVTTAGDTLYATAAGTLARAATLKSVIYGFTYANNAGDVTNDLDIAAGGAMDSTAAYWMTGAALTKQSDAAWAVGTAAGGLDNIGSAGNNDFYIFVIARSDTGVVDYLFSLSPTAPTMPANYTFKRLIGWFKRVGGTIVAFHTYETEGGGLELTWDSPTLDVNLANTLGTARRADAVKVPLTFSVLAHLNVATNDATNNQITYIACPDTTDLAPSTTASPLGTIGSLTTAGEPAIRKLSIRTSSTGTIAARSSLSTVDLYAVATLGFTWARRN